MHSYTFNPNYLSHSKQNLKTISKIQNLLSPWKILSISQITELLYLLSMTRLKNTEFTEKAKNLLLIMFHIKINEEDLFTIFNTLIEYESQDPVDFNQFQFFNLLFSDSISLPIGFKHLDKALYGGLKRNTLTTINSKFSSGKTSAAISIACNLVNHSFHQYAEKINILHINIGNNIENIATRYLSQLSNTPISNLLNNENINIMNNYTNRIKLLDFSSINLKSETQIEDTIKSIHQEIYPTFKFDLIVFDDLSQLFIFDYTENLLMRFYRSILQLSRDCNCAILGTNSLRSESMISFELKRISSTIIDIEKSESEYNFLIKKSRFGVPPGTQQKLYFNSNYLKFHE